MKVYTLLSLLVAVGAQDDIGFARGLRNLSTANFDFAIVSDSGTLASLRPAGKDDVDFLPFDLMQRGHRLENGTYHWGDLTIRYRASGNKNDSLGNEWLEADSAAARVPIEGIHSNDSLVASALENTAHTGPLKIYREWIDIDGDLGLRFTIKNRASSPIEIGSLGFAAAVNNIFTGRSAEEIYTKCFFADPYIGMDAGHLRITPLSGLGQALVVTPLPDTATPLEAYRWMRETRRSATGHGTNGFEGFFEWQVLTAAYAEDEWRRADPWNEPSAKVLPPGEDYSFGVRFSIVDDVRQIDEVIRRQASLPTAFGIPGFIVPRNAPASLHLQTSIRVADYTVHPEGALELELSLEQADVTTFKVLPHKAAFGRARLTIAYEDGQVQTIHYFITKPSAESVADLGRFLATEHWFEQDDPFGRSPSIMGYDIETRSIVDQEGRAKAAGLSDEGGSGAYVAFAIKQVFHPNIDEIEKLERFIDGVLWGVVQRSDYSVIRSAFFYEPELMSEYEYDPRINWNQSRALSRDVAFEINRAYNYVWPAATYWAMYRVGRAYPGLLKNHDWNWHLDQAALTIVRCMQSDVEYTDAGLMGETVFGAILEDLIREDHSAAQNVSAILRTRADKWTEDPYPFGSEMAWDSTGQEGVYYWARHFGHEEMKQAALHSVLGYTPTVPHWGYNGNARRYWDFGVAGKDQVTERQIHHYGSGLNALVLLSAFRDDPSDIYLLRAGYAGVSGPLSNIDEEGFASCAMHAWPEHLYWDGYSADYGQNFLGMALGSGTFLVHDPDLDRLTVYGGVAEESGSSIHITLTDPIRQRLFLPSGTEISISAGVIQSFKYNKDTGSVSLTLGWLDGAPIPTEITVWIKNSSGGSKIQTNWRLSAEGSSVTQERGGWYVKTGDNFLVLEVVEIRRHV